MPTKLSPGVTPVMATDVVAPGVFAAKRRRDVPLPPRAITAALAGCWTARPIAPVPPVIAVMLLSTPVTKSTVANDSAELAPVFTKAKPLPLVTGILEADAFTPGAISNPKMLVTVGESNLAEDEDKEPILGGFWMYRESVVSSSVY